MALFSSNKKKTPAKKVASKKPLAQKEDHGKHENAIKAPWFSEKALIGTERGVYVFSIHAHTTKHDVAYAIQKAYGVTPLKVRIANLPAKKKNLRNRRGEGSRARRHKAYVYLKKGETIQFA